jgi:ferredoxin
VWLDDSRCAACVLAGTRAAVARAADLASRTLAAWGRSHAILSYERDGALLEARPHAVRHLGDARPRATRRQFLSLFRGADRDRAGRSAGREEHLACGVQLLAAPLSDAPLPPERFARLRVGHSCSACGACAKVCPTSALRATASSSRFALELTPVGCLGPDCAVCALTCPSGAISMEGTADARWLGRERETLLELPLTSCDECHAPVASQTTDGLCASCRNRRDGRGSLIAEILARPGPAAQR